MIRKSVKRFSSRQTRNVFARRSCPNKKLKRGDDSSHRALACAFAPRQSLSVAVSGGRDVYQSNRLETDSSAAVRAIASEMRPAIESVRILAALRTASVGWIESVMTSSLSREEVMRVTAPPESTPWEMYA